MPPRLLPRWFALLSTTFVLAACSAPDGLAPNASGSDAAESTTARGSASTGTSASGGAGGSQSVEQREIDEKARVAAEALRQQAVYDSLKRIWQDALDDGSSALGESLICDPLQYVATVKIVGPEGGDVDFGPHKLRIPAGALSQRTVITAEAPTSLAVLARFSPHGTVFAAGRHPTLELSYKHCINPPGHTARIGYLGSDGTVVEWPPSTDFPEEAFVRGLIGHFSSYIVAY